MGYDLDSCDEFLRDDEGFIVLEYKMPRPKTMAMKKRFSLTDTREIVLRHGHIAITNYRMGDCRGFEKLLSSWDKVRHQYHFIGGYYVEELRELRINRGMDTKFLSKFFPGTPIRVENTPYKYENMDIDLLAAPRDDFQRVALTFMTGQDIYATNKRYTQKMVTAIPGAGKTYCGVACTAFYRAHAVVIVPLAKLLGQWKQSYHDFTTLKDSDVLCVQGGKMCQDIIDGKYKKVKVFIIMIDTIVSYQKRNGDIKTMELFEAMNCFMKIIDEVHLDMKSISMIEALTNFQLSYYMSASPDRSDDKQSFIFHTLFRNTPSFGSAFIKQDEKHLNIMVKKYLWTPDSLQIRSMVSMQTGMNTKAYERELISSPSEQRQSFDDSLRVMLNWSKGIVKPENRIMILAQSIDTLYYLQKIVEEVFPGESAVYYGGMNKKDKPAALKARIIIGTTSSLGTGADLRGLQHVYNVSTYANKIGAIQISGRCRALPDGTPVVYCELVNFGYRKTVSQYMKRKPYLINQSKTGKIIVVN